jgi:hypothetical protein
LCACHAFCSPTLSCVRAQLFMLSALEHCIQAVVCGVISSSLHSKRTYAIETDDDTAACVCVFLHLPNHTRIMYDVFFAYAATTSLYFKLTQILTCLKLLCTLKTAPLSSRGISSCATGASRFPPSSTRTGCRFGVDLWCFMVFNGVCRCV